MFYSILKALFTSLLRISFRFKVEGAENLPKKTNFIIVANHSSFLDPLAVEAAIPGQIYWVAMKSLYNSFILRWLIHKGGALLTGNASGRAIYLLTQNKNIGLFPEGTRTHDGKLKEFRRGAALLALKTGRPIVPCAIIGAYGAYPRSARLPRLFHPIKVKIGRPKYLLKESAQVIDDIYLQEGIFKIRNTIQEMLNAG